MSEEFEIIDKTMAIESPTLIDNDKATQILDPILINNDVSVVKDQVYILKSQNKAKMSQMERVIIEKFQEIQSTLEKQRTNLSLQQEEMENKQKVTVKRVMDILSDQRQQLYSVNSFVEDCFNELHEKYKIERSIYDSKIQRLVHEMDILKIRLSKLEESKAVSECSFASGIIDVNQFLCFDEEMMKNLDKMDHYDSRNAPDMALNLIDLDYKTICVKTIHDQSFNVSVGIDATIAQVKSVISQVVGISKRQQILVGNGKICDDASIDFESILYLIISK